LYGLRIGDSPEQVDILMKRAGFSKERETLNGDRISLTFSKDKIGAGFWFKDKKLIQINIDVGNSNFDTLANDLRLSSGYPSYYSADEKKAMWSIKNNSIITRVNLSQNPGENCRIIIREGW